MFALHREPFLSAFVVLPLFLLHQKSMWNQTRLIGSLEAPSTFIFLIERQVNQ